MQFQHLGFLRVVREITYDNAQWRPRDRQKTNKRSNNTSKCCNWTGGRGRGNQVEKQNISRFPRPPLSVQGCIDLRDSANSEGAVFALFEKTIFFKKV